MPYLSLPNFNYDSGPRRIQSGPDHEGYVVLYSGVQSTGPDEGIVVAGAPLSGTITQGAWDYDANWRYVPSTLQTQSGGADPTPYNASGALDTYDGVRISTRNTVAGAQIASAIGPQPGSTVSRSEKYMYFGGAAPDNQNYSPYNTPEINLAAEGKTGGGVTHRTFESSLLTNVLGSQGTSDRSQWRYHQPVYCKTYTETRRSEVPGLMSTPLRAVYRGESTSYSYNYGGELAANRGGFELLPSDYPPTSVPGSGTIAYPDPLFVGSLISGVSFSAEGLISWYRVDASTGNKSLITQGSSSYRTTCSDIGSIIEAEVGSPDPFSPTGFGTNGSAGTTPVVLPYNLYSTSITASGQVDPSPGATNTWFELWYVTIGSPIFLGGCLNYALAYWNPQRLPLSSNFTGITLPSYQEGPIITSPCDPTAIGPDSQIGIIRTFTNTNGTTNTSNIQGPRNFYSQFTPSPLIEWRVELYFRTPASPNTISASQVYCN